MIALVDSSVIARLLLGEPNPLQEWEHITRAYASRLVLLELGRLIDRLRLSSSIDDTQVVQLHQELKRVIDSIDLLAMTEQVLQLAGGPMPTQLGSLDAIHLASAIELQRHLATPVGIATHDLQLARASRAMGMEVWGV
ncbi:MAG: PIN domain-containing protein [Myxococcota bacterium]